MRVRFSWLAMLALAATTSTHAADWNQEPKTFRSIALSEPLAAQFPECAKDKHGQYAYAPQNICWQTDNKPNRYAHNSVIAEIFNLPDIGIGDTLVKGIDYTQVYLLEGKVEAVSLNFQSARYESFLGLLTNKYGQASISDTIMPTPTNQVWGRVNVWKGPNVTMRFVEFYLRPAQSRFDLETSKYAALEEADDQSKKQEQRNNL